MKAMILAAGLGTRLRPITEKIPKALVPYRNKPLLLWCIEKIATINPSVLVVNVHHLASQIYDFFSKNKFPFEVVISDETDLLLDTGGGVFKARQNLEDSTFLVHNVDIISDINLSELVDFHCKNESVLTLACQKRKGDKLLYFDKETLQLCKWKNEKTGEEKIINFSENLVAMGYSGIFVAEPIIFKYMHEGVYSIIETFLEVAKYHKVICFDHSNTFWKDMGKPESFE